MQRPIRIFYVGTYEDDYPRNVLTIAALRRAGYTVREVNQPVWAEIRDKTALLESPRSLFTLGRRLLLAYSRLVTNLVMQRKDADLVVFGYIGQLDLLLLGLMPKLFRIPVLFDPLITLTDTLVEDRGKLRPSGIAEIEGERYSVVAEGDMIGPGVDIIVVNLEGNSIVVNEQEKT